MASPLLRASEARDHSLDRVATPAVDSGVVAHGDLGQLLGRGLMEAQSSSTKFVMKPDGDLMKLRRVDPPGDVRQVGG